MAILCLSNGHGEDIIALRVIEQLQRCYPNLSIAALPLVGQGHAYSSAGVSIVGPVQQMPSGGFIYMDPRQLLRDLSGGLFGLTLAQYQVVREHAKAGGHILAVGDIVPLLFAFLSGADYAFIGTAKSEYYLRDETGWLINAKSSEKIWGSVYLPWERFLLSSARCRAVFARDSLTSEILQSLGVCCSDLGNPMMDALDPDCSDPNTLTVLLLPGSRSPEAQNNWKLILQAIEQLSFEKITFLAALSPSLEKVAFESSLIEFAWQQEGDSRYQKENSQLILSQSSYSHYLAISNIAIAMAGTATEQFVGLGKPVISIVGKGPQFTYAFAEAQTRLLGCSVTLVGEPNQVPEILKGIVNEPSLLAKIAKNGKRRLGNPGAAARIAKHLGSIFDPAIPGYGINTHYK